MMTRVMLCLTAILVMLSPAVVQSQSASQAPAEVKLPVLGEYNGEWKAEPYAGPFYIKLKKFDGTKVSGELYMTVSSSEQYYYNRPLPFVGEVADGRIKVTTGALPLDLAVGVDGREQVLDGTAQGKVGQFSVTVRRPL